MKVLHLDTNHSTLLKQLYDAGFENHEDYTSSKTEIEKKVHDYDGIIIRSRFSIDQSFLEKAINLKFIGRVDNTIVYIQRTTIIKNKDFIILSSIFSNCISLFFTS